MKQFRSYIYQSSADFTRAMLWEAKYIFRDKAVFFSFVIVAIAVSFIYTYLYSEETLQELPIGVVDEDNTAQSRQLLRMIDATSQTAIYSSYLNLTEAEKAFQQEKIRGIVAIPNGFARDLQRGEQPTISVYADASYMLYYKQILTAAKVSATYLNAGVEVKRTSAQGKLPIQARDEAMPVSAQVVSLYNPSLGYATFLIPIVLVIIFQTTILTAVGMLGGTMREGNKLKKIYPNSDSFWGALPIVMGKATTYLAFSMVILLIILGIIMPLFGIPVRSTILSTMVFMIPFILSIVFMGLCLLNFLHRREDAIMLIMYTSLPAVMLTGFSWPTVAMPEWLSVFSYIVPTTLGSKGFISITQMGAHITTIMPYWLGMWALCLVYLVLATLTLRRVLNK
ncbi:ABC-2 family transporter protein [Capnocytophaga sp. oral taxon 412 str. F0487]|uniref:ABC transporter permease n=1 Tax=Capnocytophaga sp. oral taxon 412 TaxID=712218 RepID=UPI0002696C2E|nr:ABC transporter permease [Capnocytophaga sp. oral taxon 412]EIW93609.1 ABC-2 family transporter protein [Capnocytophaga sp. oral taxon 412 str. F0487]